MNILIFIFSSLLIFSNTLNLNKQMPSKAILPPIECKDFVVNGSFNTPNQFGGWNLYSEILGWTSSYQIEVGNGSIYNGNWGKNQVVELDSSRNTVTNKYLRQVVELDNDYHCEFSFQHAARRGF